ncbi:hypothetical protein HK105_202380 [Polyrhizophydium stewartii]|uniref:RING-type E3 ubiquitin transferase n=1 Tax=Polyrhizophydium stewartii TaxID=2732419 RepID=A0ABR4NEK7_9FUNG
MHRALSAQAKVREFAPAFFRAQPAALERLVPWIRRDLQALLHMSDVEIVKDIVVSVLKRHEPRSDEAIKALSDFLGENAEHFLHELVCFASSPFNIPAYDAAVQYPSIR